MKKEMETNKKKKKRKKKKKKKKKKEEGERKKKKKKKKKKNKKKKKRRRRLPRSGLLEDIPSSLARSLARLFSLSRAASQDKVSSFFAASDTSSDGLSCSQ